MRSYLMNSGNYWLCTGSTSVKDRIVFSSNEGLELNVSIRTDGGVISPLDYCGIIGQTTLAYITEKECSQVVSAFDSWKLGGQCSLWFISDSFRVETEIVKLTNQELELNLVGSGRVTCNKRQGNP